MLCLGDHAESKIYILLPDWIGSPEGGTQMHEVGDGDMAGDNEWVEAEFLGHRWLEKAHTESRWA